VRMGREGSDGTQDISSIHRSPVPLEHRKRSASPRSCASHHAVLIILGLPACPTVCGGRPRLDRASEQLRCPVEDFANFQPRCLARIRCACYTCTLNSHPGTFSRNSAFWLRSPVACLGCIT
jgi:hypothetical protein